MPKVEAIAPSLFVKSLGRAVDFYVRVLGFEIVFQGADFAGVTMGRAMIILVAARPPEGVVYKGACHLRLASGVDEYAAKIEAAGHALAAKPEDRIEYGMREACVRDPDGNDIYFAQSM